MVEKEDNLDRLYEMVNEGHVPKPVRILIVLVSIFYGPILALIDEISKRSS